MREPIQIGDATLYLGDACVCMAGMAENSVDAIVTDPPYNIGYDYGPGFKDVADPDHYWAGQMQLAEQIGRILVPGGQCFYLHYPEQASRFFWAAQEVAPLCGIRLLAWIYHQHTGGRPFRRGTRLWAWLAKAGAEPRIGREATLGTYRNPTDARIKERLGRGLRPVDYDWWMIEQVKNVSREKTEHPCQVPEAMISRVLGLGSAEGESCLDPFMGSGTTGVAALKMGRKFIGIEIDPHWFDVACKRIADAMPLFRTDAEER